MKALGFLDPNGIIYGKKLDGTVVIFTIQQKCLYMIQHQPQISILGLFTLMVSVVLFGFFMYQMYFILVGKTVSEHIRYDRLAIAIQQQKLSISSVIFSRNQEKRGFEGQIETIENDTMIELMHVNQLKHIYNRRWKQNLLDSLLF